MSGRSAADLLPAVGGARGAVQRRAVQRDEAPTGTSGASDKAPDSGKSADGAKAGGTTTQEQSSKLKLERTFPAFKLTGWPIELEPKLSVEYSGKVEQKDGKPATAMPADGKSGDGAAGGLQPAQDAPNGTTLRVGTQQTSGKAAGWEAELKHKFDKIGPLTPDARAGVELTKDGGKVSAACGLEWDLGAVKFKPSVEFTFVKAEKGEKGLKVEFATLAVALEASQPIEKTLDDGSKITGEMKWKGTLALKPNYVELAKLVAAKAAAAVGALVTSPAFLFGAPAIAALIGGLALIGNEGAAGRELDTLSRTTVLECRRYCLALIAAMTGNEIALAAGEGATRGAADGRARLAELAEKAGVSVAVAQAAAAEKLGDPQGFYNQTWGQAWPLMRAQAVAQYGDKIGWLRRNLTTDADKLGKLLDAHAQGSAGSLE